MRYSENREKRTSGRIERERERERDREREREMKQIKKLKYIVSRTGGIRIWK
jgi:hypothetical protein